ncbi:MAG: ABC transporter substrate-binding protein [Actinomycetota bacterium]
MLLSRFKSLLVLLAALSLIAAACSGDDSEETDASASASASEASDEEASDEEAMEEEDDEAMEEEDDEAMEEEGDGDLAGTTVTISGPENSELDTGALTAAFAPFTERTGIEVIYTGSRDFSDNVGVQAEAGTATDILFFPQPGKVADFARDGFIQALPDDVVEASNSNWSSDWTGFGTVDGTVYGVPVKADLKSLVWYQPAVFEEKGYEVPGTWDDFKALADEMIANGDTPLCVGIESGGATGWAFTDWMEDLMLRFHGAEVYDQWVNHEIPFNDERVVEVMDEILTLWNTPGMVFASGGTIATTPFAENAVPLVEQDCLMHRQANFFAGNFPEGTPANDGSAEAVNAFYFPTVNGDRPLLVAGVIATAFNDRPEVMEVLKYATTAEYADARQAYQSEQLGGSTSGFLSAVSGWDAGNLNALEASFLDIFAAAEVTRFDASDLMPAAVGAGTFWTEGTAAVNGDKTAQEAADAIEDSWP